MLIGKLLDVRKTRFWNAGSTPAVRHRILNQAPQSP